MKKYIALTLISLVMAASPALAADKPVELTPAEMTALQSRSYETPIATTFTATISMMQSMGYLNINANHESGTITGETESKGKIIYNILWGVGKKKQTQLASLFLEQVAPTKTLVKLNLTMNEAKSRGLFGNAFKDGIIIKDAAPYQQFYTALDAEIARRVASAASAVPGGAATTTLQAAPDTK